ncbi:MAG: Zn-ribbon domain-containing OB-fold protein [Candidatus Micrarchaeota archaeon]|nr:Zn-ribbon domain-containing OB-fold protein [Candidatus Micrarchaeota archaeon]
MKISVPGSWRKIPHRYRLEGTKCVTCGTIYFPPRVICPKCRRKGKIVPYKEFSGRGKIISWSTVYTPPRGFEDIAPYILAIIELEEGPRLLAQVVDAKEEEIYQGREVELVTRRVQEDNPDGLILYGYKFRLR